MESKPRISVIMSVYNSEPFLREAVDSILNQTFGDFEFLIVDDKSTDGSLEILKSYSDNRIQIFENHENIGLTKSLNILLKIAKGEFIARMDADDISLPERFERQLNYFSQNKVISFCGTNVISFEGKKSNLPLTHDELMVEMMEYNPFAHPTMLFKRQDFINFNLMYNEEFRVAQDYDLWSRAILILKCGNLRESLVRYRNHGNRVGVKNLSLSNELSKIIKLNYLNGLNYYPIPKYQDYHNAIFGDKFKIHRDHAFLNEVDLYMSHFHEWNVRNKVFNNDILIQKWSSIYYDNKLYNYNWRIYLICKNSKIHSKCKPSSLKRIKFIIKCLINYSLK